MGLALTVALPAFASAEALASGNDSTGTASTSDSTSTPPSPGDSITVTLDGGKVLHAAFVGPASQGFLRVIQADGGEELVGDQHVKRIANPRKKDLTDIVLRDRKSVGTVPGQATYQPKKHHEPCFKVRPLPTCKTCMVTQVGYVGLLSGSDLDPPGSSYFIFDLGVVRNMSPRSGVGGGLYFETNDAVSRFGAKARLRRWINPRVAVDLAPGVLFAGSDSWNGTTSYPGFIFEANLMFRGWFAFAAGFESIQVSSRYTDVFGTVTTTDVSDFTWYAGIKLAGVP